MVARAVNDDEGGVEEEEVAGVRFPVRSSSPPSPPGIKPKRIVEEEEVFMIVMNERRWRWIRMRCRSREPRYGHIESVK